MLRILIVEDEPTIADTLVYALETEGYRATWVMTAEKAMTVFAEGVDGVILDVGLPDASAFDLCRWMRKQGDLPILFLTARSGEVDRIVGLELGADDYVVKPFSPREVTARLRAVLRRYRPPLTEAAQARMGSGDGASNGVAGEGERLAVSGAKTNGAKTNGVKTKGTEANSKEAKNRGSESLSTDEKGLKDNAAQCRMEWNGSPLDLSAQEYRILSLLHANQGRVYSRRQLMEAVWESPDSAMERAVDAHVKSIRAKLRVVAPDAEIIVTHRGFGYSAKA